MNLGSRIAICGGSISNRAGYSNTPNQGFSQTNWLEWWQAMAGQPFQIVSMAGEGGRHISEVDTNFASEVAAFSPEVVVLGGDCAGNYLYAGNTVASAIQYLASIHAKCQAIGANMICWTLPPNNNISATNDSSFANTELTHEYNRLLMAYGKSNADILVVPFHWHVDLAATDGRMVTTAAASLTTTAWTHDGTHPHPKLAIKLAQLLDYAVRGYTLFMLPHACNADGSKALANPLNYGTFGTNGAGNGNSSNVACTEEPRTDIGDGGSWKRISVINAPQSPVYTFGGAWLMPSKMAVGTPVRALVEVKLNAIPTNLRGLKVTLSFTGSTETIGGFNTSSSGAFSSLADAGPFIPTGKTLWLSTAINEIPAGTTGVSVALEATKGSGGNITANLSVGRAMVIAEPSVPNVVFAQETP